MYTNGKNQFNPFTCFRFCFNKKTCLYERGCSVLMVFIFLADHFKCPYFDYWHDYTGMFKKERTKRKLLLLFTQATKYTQTTDYSTPFEKRWSCCLAVMRIFFYSWHNPVQISIFVNGVLALSLPYLYTLNTKPP